MAPFLGQFQTDCIDCLLKPHCKDQISSVRLIRSARFIKWKEGFERGKKANDTARDWGHRYGEIAGIEEETVQLWGISKVEFKVFW
ncbi:hypothetical protein COLO4_09646 [Corchorus olitorius]|uniref:Uncharacterized protein n=1 Tax=Corchorus olitorius TaxID=93759 RepID=A0A1R3KBI3_9ROSI|nr:hypothetical protein COLO4_09646 [Corchorus olitorius]